MSSIIGFFDGTTLRAASLSGLLIKNKQNNYWQLKHGVTEMPFPDTIEMFKNAYITVNIYCIASSHVPIHMTTTEVIHEYSGSSRGRLLVRKSGHNIYSVEFDGFLSCDKGSWGLKDPGATPMPLGIALNNAECRLVEMAVEQTYGSMPSILDCHRQIIYP